MSGQPDERATPSEPDRQDAVRHAEVALRSIGQPNSVAGEFDFWDNSYEGRRLFSEVLPGVGYHPRHAQRAWRDVVELLAECLPVSE